MKRDGVAEHASMALMPGDVRDYLLRHPDFLADNGDLLAELVPPVLQRGDGVEDFQHYMLTKLQEHSVAIKGEHDDLMALMQEHLQRQNRANVAILSMLDAPCFRTLLQFVTRDLAVLMDQEVVALFLEAGNGIKAGNFGGLQVCEAGFVRQWLQDGDIDLAEHVAVTPELFGEKCATVRSRALVRLDLDDGMPPGVLAFGHREAMYYATGLATEQVECMGAVLERCLMRWL